MQRLILNSFVVFSSILFSGMAQAGDRPNILLVMADDLGWSDIGSYGGEIDTPRLDELAARGTLFTDFHASVSCSPTRAMLMSGNDNHIAGLGTMSEMLVDNQRGQPGYEGYLKWSGKFGQRAKMYPTRLNGYKNDKATEFFRQV